MNGDRPIDMVIGNVPALARALGMPYVVRDDVRLTEKGKAAGATLLPSGGVLVPVGAPCPVCGKHTIRTGEVIDGEPVWRCIEGSHCS